MGLAATTKSTDATTDQLLKISLIRDHYSLCTVTITGSVAVTSSTLHRLLDSEAGTLQVNLLTVGVLQQGQRGLPQSPGLPEGVARLALSLPHQSPPSQYTVKAGWEAAGVPEVAELW